MKGGTLEKAFNEYLNRVTLGLMALAEHFRGGPVEFKRVWEEEDDSRLLGLEIIKDGEVIYHHEEGKGRELFEGLMINIVQAEKAACYGDNHQECKVCVYILSCIEDQMNSIEALAEEMKKRRLAAKLKDVVTSLPEALVSLIEEASKPESEQSEATRRIIKKADLSREYCKEKGWPGSPFELSAEQHEELDAYVEQKMQEEGLAEDEPSGPPSCLSEAEG